MRTMIAIAAASLCWLPLTCAAAQRAFVSISGSDANAAAGCSLAAPCRWFDTAIGVLDTNGEVVALDSGGYGRFTANESGR